MGAFTRWVFGVSERRVTFASLGFHGAERVRLRLERAGRSFLAGYHAALAEDGGAAALAARLDRLDPEQRGFGYEGAGLGLVVRDAVAPWRPSRLAPFLAGPAAGYVHLVHVGAGWALGRMHLPAARLRPRLHPELWWLALDGYGFHEGYFRLRLRVDRQLRPRRLRGYERRAFDQGLGRSLWFSAAADPRRLVERIEAFPAARRADLWSGVGLAASYAGGADAAALRHLRLVAGAARPALAQGAAFGAKAHLLAGVTTPWTQLACTVLCDVDAETAAAITDEAFVGLPPAGEDGEPPFEVWRLRIQRRLSGAAGAAAAADRAPAARREALP